MVRIHTTISVDNDNLQKAFAEGLNISEICDIAIKVAVDEKENIEIKALNDKLKQINEVRLQLETIKVDTLARLIKHARMVNIIDRNENLHELKLNVYDKLATDEREAWFETYSRQKGYDIKIFKEQFNKFALGIKTNGSM